MDAKTKYTIESLREAIRESLSWRMVCNKIGLYYGSLAIERLTKAAIKNNISYAHFLGQAVWKDNIRGPSPFRKSAILHKGTCTHNRKLALIRDEFKTHKCEKCERIEWNGDKIPLELHHIDGDKKNNDLSNLLLLCPNCHAQTPNYGTRNRKKPNKRLNDPMGQ